MYTQNIIMIIGNGFALAHNLKTSFSDYLIENEIVPGLKNVVRNAEKGNGLFKRDFINQILKKSGQVVLDNYMDVIRWEILQNRPEKVVQYLKGKPSEIQQFISNSFLGKLYANQYLNWFDIENTYFSELVSFKNEAMQEGIKFDKKNLEKLNEEFTEIKTLLSKYLNSIEITKSPNIQSFFEKHLANVKNLYIVNFNYTNTIEPYLESFRNSLEYEINYIHGSLADDDIIFGYGNDKNSDYEEIKELKIDEFLTYFKTFEYQRNSNYNRIYESALESFNVYQILVLGHSLGTTDKTLLAELFNSNRCNRVHLFKRKNLEAEPKEVLLQDFIKRNYAASRIFANEEKLRRKLINFEDSSFFPE